eukprot:Clim_evm12s7 gene=Clim_evmTU12s7
MKSRSGSKIDLWSKLTESQLHYLVDDFVLKSHFGNSHLRGDTWSEIQTLAELQLQDDVSAEDKAEGRIAFLSKLKSLLVIEAYFTFPGLDFVQQLMTLYHSNEFQRISHKAHCVQVIGATTYSYNPHTIAKQFKNWIVTHQDTRIEHENFSFSGSARPYFEVLIVSDADDTKLMALKENLEDITSPTDGFEYEFLMVSNAEDAINAVLLNYNIQCVVIGSKFGRSSEHGLKIPYSAGAISVTDGSRLDMIMNLSENLNRLRPEIGMFHFSSQSVEVVASLKNHFKRIYYNLSHGDLQELHYSIMESVQSHYNTPFFDAVKKYSTRPTGVFHALPISRASSLLHSNWAKDMLQFYGKELFMAETSATSGGLDSLLEPHGPIRDAQVAAAKTFGADRSYFVTNGTSTANKIVVQGLLQPGDIVLIDRNCHKSHHYGAVLSGAHVHYLDSYKLADYAMYGGVPLKLIKQTLMEYKKSGKLSKVKLLLLTNCTFDGIVYNVRRVVEECLAIKSDLIFLWDEAWWAFAYFHPVYRMRTAMGAANTLKIVFKSEEYRQHYAKWAEENKSVLEGGLNDEDFVINNRLYPNPDEVRLRLYATQSTHKTLTSLRQGSMIHVHDEDFRRLVEPMFTEAYFTHTSTSPNYQILASLDIGRRQCALEGYALVTKQIEHAFTIRHHINLSEGISPYFKVLGPDKLIPAEYRSDAGADASVRSSLSFDGSRTFTCYDFEQMWESWSDNEFVLDPNRITLCVADAGIDGDTFKNKYLMEEFEIQVNKTSINSVLLMTTIGTSRSACAYLLEALTHLADKLDVAIGEFSHAEELVHKKKVHRLTQELPPLPDFSHFHPAFRGDSDLKTSEGILRKAFYLSYNEENTEYFEIGSKELDKVDSSSRTFVASTFVIPYPPGFPILVPGQVVTSAVIEFMRKLDVKEIHGYNHELGLRLFTDQALKSAK